jgi:hypothetical protein
VSVVKSRVYLIDDVNLIPQTMFLFVRAVLLLVLLPTCRLLIDVDATAAIL